MLFYLKLIWGQSQFCLDSYYTFACYPTLVLLLLLFKK